MTTEVRQVGGATIARVAERAGVSRATVSRVMNGRPGVTADLVSRVQEAAEALHYAPSPVARSLALGRTSTVALIVPDLANPLFQEVLRGLGKAAAKEGHRLLVAETNEDVGTEADLARDARRRTDGLVMASSRLPAEELERLAPTLAPVVLLNREVSSPAVPWLSVDHVSGIRHVVAHLQELGHRRLAYLAGPSESVPNQDRCTVLHEMARTDPRFELVVIPCGATFDAGHESAARVAAAGVTAVVAFNDMVAFGVLSGLRELGVGVPEDLSVTGFDDIPLARWTTPPLTTASGPHHELGRQAWRRLWSLLRGEPAERSVLFQPRLAVRGSTGPARS